MPTSFKDTVEELGIHFEHITDDAQRLMQLLKANQERAGLPLAFALLHLGAVICKDQNVNVVMEIVPALSLMEIPPTQRKM